MDLFESEINWLREELNKHNYNYYVLNKPTVSDKEYDDMMRRLQDLEAEHKELFDPLSPSQRVGPDAGLQAGGAREADAVALKHLLNRGG